MAIVATASPENTVTDSAEVQIPLADVTRFVRQLSHDLRNHLNAAELQSAYISEIAEDPELKSEIKRLREMTASLGKALQNLTTSLAQVKLTKMPYRAADFVEDLQQKVGTQFRDQAPAIQWNAAVAEAMLEIDPQLLQEAMLELFANAFRHGRSEGSITASFKIAGGSFVFTLQEPKIGFTFSTDRWGHEPFHTVGHGHYGLGLHRARSILDAHGGKLEAHYDANASALVTSVTVPLSPNDK